MSKRSDVIDKLQSRHKLSEYEATLAFENMPNSDRINETSIDRMTDLIVQDWGGVKKIKQVAEKQKPVDDEEDRRVKLPGQRDKLPEDLTPEERAATGTRDDRTPAERIADMSADEVATAAEDGSLDAILGELGDPGAAARGAPLWRYVGPPETLADLTVANRSHVRSDRGGFGSGRQGWGGPERTGARYYEQDTLEPLKWSPEQRADMQRVLSSIGLYGNAKVKLGSWGAKDQEIYAQLLIAANEEGLTWLEMLNKWKREPPTELLEELEGEKRAPLVIQHTNPMDVQETAREVSRGLIGREDRGFIDGTPGGYNAAETAAQTAAYNAADPDGGGGTVVDAPSVGAFTSDALRRSKPAEVDSYATLGAFNEILRELGLAG